MTVHVAKRYSTWANIIALALAAVMTYIPDIVPEDKVSVVMAGCSAIVAVCQFIKQGVFDDVR